MAAPSYVPVDPEEHPRYYASPALRDLPWRADRPAELVGQPMPSGGLYGNHGPDIGYAYKLVHLVSDKIKVQADESKHDVEKGAVAVAMRRAALFGRAPILADLDVALTIWGYYDEQPASGLRVMRGEMFEGAGHHHGYPLLREISNAVSEHALRMTPAQVASAHDSDWAGLFTDH